MCIRDSLTGDGEARVVHGLGPDDDPGRLLLRLGGTRAGDQLAEGEGQLAQPDVRHRRHLEDAVAAGLQVGADHLGEVLAVRHVHLVQDDDAGPVAQAAVLPQLLLDDVEVGGGVTVGLQGRGVQHVHQHAAPLHVPQELQAQAAALAGAGDETGHVGDGVHGGTGGHHTQVRDQRGERIVRDLRLGRAQHGDQRGLAGARIADEGHVRDGLQLQDDVLYVTGLAEQREAGRLAAGGGQRRVAEAAPAALRGDVRGAVADQVGEDVARLVQDDRAVRHGQDQVLAVLAGAVAALAGLAVGGLAVRGVVIVEQRRDRLVDGQDDVTAPAAVAAVGACLL